MRGLTVILALIALALLVLMLATLRGTGRRRDYDMAQLAELARRRKEPLA